MNDEIAFRILFLAALLATYSISGFYRRRAETQSQERISLKQEGALLAALLRLGGLALLAAALAYVVRPQWMAWSSLELPDWLRWAAGGVSLGVMPLLAYWVFSNLDRNVTSTVVTRQEHALVTTGPYRWVRHPLYTLGVMFWLAQAVLSANWFFALAMLLAMTGLLVRTPKEEAMLIERFGDEYRAYMQRTGRFLPRLWAATSRGEA